MNKIIQVDNLFNKSPSTLRKTQRITARSAVKKRINEIQIDNLFNKPLSPLRNAKKNTAHHCVLCGKKIQEIH